MWGVALILGLVSGAFAGEAESGQEAEPPKHTYEAPNGVDLYEELGLEAHLLTHACVPKKEGEEPDSRCVVSEGEGLFTIHAWTTNYADSEVPMSYPEGYAPADPDPMKDFLSKLTGIRYVLDPGTPEEQTFEFEAKDALLRKGKAGDFYDLGQLFLDDGGLMPLSSPKTYLGAEIPAPKAGPHSIAFSWILSAESCDGYGANRESACVPAGDFALPTRSFVVVQGAEPEVAVR